MNGDDHTDITPDHIPMRLRADGGGDDYVPAEDYVPGEQPVSEADDYFGDLPEPLRRFALVRHEDATGVSGTGIVGVGVELPDGTAVFMWTNDSNPDGPDTKENSVYVYPGGMHDVDEVHGHDGRTEIVFLDSEGNA